jgi:two-component system response regulator
VPNANVLLIEDSPADAMLLKIALDEAGFDYNLTAFRDGASAVEYVRAQSKDSGLPDIILLDINVPKVNGLDVLKEIRRVDRFVKIPVLVLSSSQSPREQSALLSVTDVRFEIKPSDLDGYLELGRTIRSVLTGDGASARRA